MMRPFMLPSPSLSQTLPNCWKIGALGILSKVMAEAAKVRYADGLIWTAPVLRCRTEPAGPGLRTITAATPPRVKASPSEPQRPLYSLRSFASVIPRVAARPSGLSTLTTQSGYCRSKRACFQSWTVKASRAARS
jgi:hypothetical protein